MSKLKFKMMISMSYALSYSPITPIPKSLMRKSSQRISSSGPSTIIPPSEGPFARQDDQTQTINPITSLPVLLEAIEASSGHRIIILITLCACRSWRWTPREIVSSYSRPPSGSCRATTCCTLSGRSTATTPCARSRNVPPSCASSDAEHSRPHSFPLTSATSPAERSSCTSRRWGSSTRRSTIVSCCTRWSVARRSS
jgi:hypothetical protein